MNLSFLFHNQFFLSISAQDPDPLDPKDFGLLDPDPETYADPHGAKLKKNEKREIIKISWSLDGSSSFSIKISEKKKKSNLTILLF